MNGYEISKFKFVTFIFLQGFLCSSSFIWRVFMSNSALPISYIGRIVYKDQ